MSPLRARPLPPPVGVTQHADGTLTDPAFEPLPGARAEHGRLGGALYQIEIPEKWNGRLVVWMHGFDELSGTLRVGPPRLRRWLITHGYAWAASSFSSTSLIPGRAADETAALWDLFVAKHGRPTWTYAFGFSMGGWATEIVAERYANRVDGALATCGAVGTNPGMRIDADFFVAAAYVAGITQRELDSSRDVEALIDTRIRPVLAQPGPRARFLDIVIDLTGGPRAFDREGIELQMDTKFRRAGLLVAGHLAVPRDAPYRLGPTSRDSSDDLNRNALRLPYDAAAFRQFSQGMEVSGRLAMPLLTMHTTGDEQVPVDQALVLRSRVHAAGRDALLAQRIVKDPGHCGFSESEQEHAFRALVDWVEHGKRPATTNLDVTDLRDVAPTFESVARPGSGGPRDAAGVTSLHGTARLDRKPLDARFIGAVVIDRGLVTPCNAAIPTIVAGRFSLDVYSESALAGCGRSGARVVLWTYAGSQKLFATNALLWPSDPSRDVAVDFSTTHPSGAAPEVFELSGSVYRAGGALVRAGALVEAFVGRTRCGVASVRSGVFDGYIMHIVGPDSIPGCVRGGRITFEVDGVPARETIANGGKPPHSFDLTVR